MEKYLIFIPLLLFCSIPFLSKPIEKCLSVHTYSLLKKISLILVIVTLIATILILFFRPVRESTYGWHVDFMDFKTLHKYSTGKSQKIALIDSGISEFQLDKNKENSLILVGDSTDKNGHGTIMYSLIKGYNNKILGIAPDAKVLSIKVMNTDESLKPNLISDAIKLSIEQKCTIINLSLGSYVENKEISDTIDAAIAKGITFVSSSGDYERADMMFPANKPNVISVGSLSAKDHISKFTNAPSECVIIAPGDDIRTVNNKMEIGNASGTSEATAIISGYIALIKDYSLQKSIGLNNDKIIHILKSINNNKCNYVTALKELK